MPNNSSDRTEEMGQLYYLHKTVDRHDLAITDLCKEVAAVKIAITDLSGPVKLLSKLGVLLIIGVFSLLGTEVWKVLNNHVQPAQPFSQYPSASLPGFDPRK